MTNPLISIIIPVYRVENYLSQCLQSVIGQSYPYLQIIIINDGSPDDSHLIIETFQKNDPRITVINKENGGLSAARNSGLDVAVGEYVMFVDSDDWVDKEICNIMINEALASDADVVMSSYVSEFSKSSVQKINFDERKIFDQETFNGLYKRIVGLTGSQLRKPESVDSLSSVWAKLYKTSLIKGILFENTATIGTEDLLYNLIILKKVQIAVCLPDILYHYRRNNVTSLTSGYKPALVDQWAVLYDKIFELIRDKNELIPAFNNRICLGIIGLGLNECNSPNTSRQKVHKLKSILNLQRYREAFNQLQLKYFPLHWKIFFFAAKHKLVLVLYPLLLAIKRIITR